mmetsp:Transcript_9501/g.33432  ORF Transcript_9501/g.33432 Transcript_9501/m.33432 type:complete len:176 (+) Transcript_9501:288-815(+)
MTALSSLDLNREAEAQSRPVRHNSAATSRCRPRGVDAARNADLVPAGNSASRPFVLEAVQNDLGDRPKGVVLKPSRDRLEKRLSKGRLQGAFRGRFEGPSKKTWKRTVEDDRLDVVIKPGARPYREGRREAISREDHLPRGPSPERAISREGRFLDLFECPVNNVVKRALKRPPV